MKFQFFIVISLLVSILSACDGAEGRKQKYMEQAASSFAEADYDKARVGYQNVLKIDPKDVPALLGFAETLEKLQDWRGSVGRYRAVLELDPENVKAKIKLGQLYLLANEIELASGMAEDVLAKDAAHSGGLTLKAGVLSKMGKLDEALTFVEQSYKIDPSSIDTIVLLASLKELSKDRVAAVALIEKELVNHPESITLHTLLSKLYLADEKLVLAERELVKLTEIAPDNINLKKQLVMFYEKTERPDKAEAVFQDIIANDDDKTQAIMGLHELYIARGDKQKAESLLKKAIADEPEEFDLQFKLASFYIFNNQLDVTESMYRKLIQEKDVVAIKAKNRLAYLLEKQGKSDESEALIAEVLKDHPGNIEALTLRGSMYLKKEDAVNAIADLRTVLNANPENVDIIKMLGSAHILNDEPELAIDMFRGALNLSPKDLPLRLKLADIYKRQKQLDKAAEQLKLADTVQPNNPQIVEGLAQVYMANNDLDNAKATVQRLMNLNTTNPRAFHYYGLVLQSEKKHEEAVKYFDESLRLKPGAIEPMSSKVRSLIALEKMDQALSWLDKVAKEQKDNSVAYNLKGELLLAKKNFSEAVTAFSEANKINPSWWVPYRNRALAAVASGDQQAAVAALQDGVEKTKGNIRLRAELANVAEQQNNIDEAIHQYEKIIESDADNALAANNLAMLLVTYNEDNEKSLQRAQELSSLLLEQKNPLYQDTAGWVHYVSGQYEKALPLIKRALISQPENPEIQYHLGMTYFKIDDKEKAKQHLATAVESEKGFRGKEQAKETLDLLNNG